MRRPYLSAALCAGTLAIIPAAQASDIRYGPVGSGGGALLADGPLHSDQYPRPYDPNEGKGRRHDERRPRLVIPIDPDRYIGEVQPMAGEDAATPGALRLTEPPMTGATVRALQRALAAQGLKPGPADGVFGPSTDRALRAYQRRALLPETGVLDETTAFELGL